MESCDWLRTEANGRDPDLDAVSNNYQVPSFFFQNPYQDSDYESLRSSESTAHLYCKKYNGDDFLGRMNGAMAQSSTLCGPRAIIPIEFYLTCID